MNIFLNGPEGYVTISVLKVGSYMPGKDYFKGYLRGTPLLAKEFIKNSIERVRIWL